MGYNGNFGLPAAPELERHGVRFTQESTYPCPECAAKGIETYMMYDPEAKEWGCPICQQDEPYADVSEIIEGLFTHLLEVA